MPRTRRYCYLVVAAVLIVGCADNNPGDASEEASADSSNVRFVRPAIGATVAGFADILLELRDVVPGSVLYWGVDDEVLEATKALASALALNTAGYPNGKHIVRAELRVGNEVLAKASRELNFDNPDFEAVSFALNQDSYQPGDWLQLDLEYSRGGLVLGADATDIDARYDASEAHVTDDGDGAYQLRYKIPAQTPAASGTHRLRTIAKDESGRSLTNEIPIVLRHEPLTPFSVVGAAYVGGVAPVLKTSESVPDLDIRSAPIPLLTGAGKTFVIAWEEGTVLDRLLVSTPGGYGYYVKAVDPNVREMSVTVDNLKPDTSGSLDVEFAAVDKRGASSGWQTTTIQVADVSLGGLQVTLFWDAPVDLDLSVVDPSQQTLDFESPSLNSGLLNLDANALCNISTALG